MDMHKKTDEPKDARPIRGRVLARVLAEDLRNVAGGHQPPSQPLRCLPIATVTNYYPPSNDTVNDGD